MSGRQSIWGKKAEGKNKKCGLGRGKKKSKGGEKVQPGSERRRTEGGRKNVAWEKCPSHNSKVVAAWQWGGGKGKMTPTCPTPPRLLPGAIILVVQPNGWAWLEDHPPTISCKFMLYLTSWLLYCILF